MITKELHQAISELENDGLVAIPTETVYGLAGNAYSEIAIRKIFELKNRPLFNPLIVHIQSADCLDEVAQNIPEAARMLAAQFWPGPLTLVLEKRDHIPNLVTAGKNTVAVRVPNHDLTLSLLKNLTFPLVAPSANPFGSISPTSAQHVYCYFENTLGIILDGGECERGLESTIVGFVQNRPVLYRHGAIPMEEIAKITGDLETVTHNEKSPDAPGMLMRHYAPSTDTYLTNNIPEIIKLFQGKRIGILVFQAAVRHDLIIHQEILSPRGNLEEAAKNLYAAMHRLDSLNLDVIIAERLPDHSLGKTMNDKLERATHKK